MLPIVATSLAGQVLSRSSSRVRSPGGSTDAVALRSQTALTGSDRPRTIRQREQGRPRAQMKLAVGRAARAPSFAPADRRWPGLSGSASGSEGQGAEAAARAARRAALKPYRKSAHGPGRGSGSGVWRSGTLLGVVRGVASVLLDLGQTTNWSGPALAGTLACSVLLVYAFVRLGL